MKAATFTEFVIVRIGSMFMADVSNVHKQHSSRSHKQTVDIKIAVDHIYNGLKKEILNLENA